MAVFQRKTTKGYTKEYHYKFMFLGKAYFGVCEGCTTKVKAEAYEKLQIETLKRGSEQRTAKAYAENMRDLLTGGHEVKLSEVFQLAMSKPRKRTFSEKQGQRKQAIFDDFIAFMTEKYPDIVNVPQVQAAHAEGYIAFIREHGRFSKDVVYERAGKSLQWKTPEKLSNKTANDFLMICKEVFSLVMRDCGLLDNPFNFIPKLFREETCREAFTEEEVKAIRNSKNDFCRNLFNIGFATALREGDACTLKWEQIDFEQNILTVQMRKTKRTVVIPFREEFKNFLLKLKKDNNSAYVLPQQAEMFLKDKSQVSYRIKKFLDELGIKTTVATDGRKRQISVKDFHSCRHTFCYFAGINNISLPIVQNMVGHMSQNMTSHYMAHVQNEDKKVSLAKLPPFLIGTTEVTETHPKKELTPFERAIIGLSGIKLLKALMKIELHLSEEAKNEIINYCKTFE